MLQISEAEHVLSQAIAAERVFEYECSQRKLQLLAETNKAQVDLLRAIKLAWADRV